MAQIKSFIRWAGGKSWLVPFVEELIDGLDFNDYYEPFMGGASIYFAIDTPNKAVLSDINNDLVKTFCAVRDNPEKIIGYLQTFKSNEESYYTIRDSEPSGKYQRAARFLYLNANSFNGLYRVNRNGKYNVPYGHKEAKVNTDKLLEMSAQLAGTEILCQDFSAIAPHVSKGDLVFLDPPYAVSNSSSFFIKYNSTLFSLEDQRRLGHLVETINAAGAYFILTNAVHEEIYEIFKDSGRLITLERNSLIGGKKAYRGKVKEYVFTNIPKRRDK